MIALPLTLLALAAVVSLAQHMPRRSETAAAVEPSPWRISLPELAVIVLLGFVVGALRATNTWDFPTYALAGLVGLVVLEITRRGPVLAAARPDGIQEWLAFGLRTVVSVVWRFVVLFAVGAVAFYPFTSKYATAYAGLEQYKDAKTLIPDYLTHWGFFIALAVAYLAAEFVSQRRERRLPAWLDDALPFIVVAGFLFIAAGWILGVQVWLVALPLAFLAAILAFGRELPPARRTALLLLALALGDHDGGRGAAAEGRHRPHEHGLQVLPAGVDLVRRLAGVRPRAASPTSRASAGPTTRSWRGPSSACCSSARCSIRLSRPAPRFATGSRPRPRPAGLTAWPTWTRRSTSTTARTWCSRTTRRRCSG